MKQHLYRYSTQYSPNGWSEILAPSDIDAFTISSESTDGPSPMVQKFQDDEWHFWHVDSETWIPTSARQVSVTVTVTGWMIQKPTAWKGPTHIHGVAELIGQTQHINELTFPKPH